MPGIIGSTGADRLRAWTCWVGDGTPCSVSAVGFPVPARRTRRAGCPRTGLSACLDGSADQFGDLPDEGHVVVAGPAEAGSGRVDHVDVEWRGDLRAAVAVALHAHLRRVVEDHRVLADPVGPVVAPPDLFPRQVRVFAAGPVDHPPPGV